MRTLILRDLQDTDRDIVEKWLQKEYILKWFENPKDWLLEIDKRNTDFSFIHHYILMDQDMPIGFCQYYNMMAAKESWDVDLDLQDVFSIDYLIGEEAYLKQGIGKQMIAMLLEELNTREVVRSVIVQPDVKNLASVNSLLSNSFRWDEKNKVYYKEMPRRDVYTSNHLVTLVYASDGDRDCIYNMAFEEDAVWQAMIPSAELFPRSQIEDEEEHFFGNVPGKSKYLLIQYQSKIVGVISHTYNLATIENMEIDIWLRSIKYTGQGIGTQAISLLVKQLHMDYDIEVFIIRPWIENKRAIKAYQKCGFIEESDFDVYDYYKKYLEEILQDPMMLYNMVYQVQY